MFVGNPWLDRSGLENLTGLYDLVARRVTTIKLSTVLPLLGKEGLGEWLSSD
jgi:hypothetical protein